MKNNTGSSKKGKSAAVGLVICFVAVIALVGAFTFSRYKRDLRNQLAKAEETNDAEDKAKEDAKKREESQTTNSQSIQNEQEEEKTEEKTEENNTGTQAQAQEVETPANTASQTASQPDALTFSESDLLTWPVDGNVLLNYSMDQTVYFSTLDQYKYNPAVIISGEVGGEVTAAARGIVKSIEVNAQTGTTITMDLGNGYEAVYGQLKEVPLKEGKYVEQGEVIGYLSEPTKYYSVEGCNLYFQLLKDGTPVNPMEYMDV